MKVKKIRCAHCRQWFEPDPRAVDTQGVCRQRFCPQDSCRKASKKEAQAKWLAKNLTYYKGEVRKDMVRQWARVYPHYWQQYRGDACHQAYREREKARMRGKRLGRVAKQDEIRQNPVGYLEGIRFLALKTVAKQDEIRPIVEGTLDYLIFKEAVAKQEIIAPCAQPAS